MKKLDVFTPYGQLPHHIIVKAWQDEKFKEKLLNDPIGAFDEAGYEAPAEKLIVTINTEKVASFVLPEMPKSLVGSSYQDMLEFTIASTGDKASGTCD